MKTRQLRVSQETYDAFHEIAEANGITITSAVSMTAKLCKSLMMNLSPCQHQPITQETTVKISNAPTAPVPQVTQVPPSESPAASALRNMIQKAKGGKT